MMRRTLGFALGLLLAGAGAGAGLTRWLAPAPKAPRAAVVAAAEKSPASAPTERRVLYWANPMNSSIHSDHPMKDNMGMDYVAVYASAAAPAPAQRRVLYWASPMNPAIHSDHPMKDNMGMDYVPVYAQAPSGARDDGLRIDARQAQNLGVRLVATQTRTLGQAMHTVGIVAQDQNRVDALTARFAGWVVHLRVRAVGDPVRRGQVLAEIYSPELYSAQQDDLIALRGQGTQGGEQILAAARERLRLLGMPEAALTTVERTGKPLREIPVLAPQSGVVTALAIRQGSYVSPQAELFEIANLQRVWVNVALYDYQLPWVRVGDAVRLRLQAYPGKTWKGRLSFLYPTVDPRTRTVTARLSFANTDGDLRPGMFADATVLGHALSTLAVPSSAVLRTQEGDYVMLAQRQGHFLPVQVALGPQADGWAAIAKGLKAGDRVVESAQFLLYSESQFQSVKARMLGGNTSLDAAPPGGTAPGMSIPGEAQGRAVAPPVLAPAAAGSMAGMNMTATGDSHD